MTVTSSFRSTIHGVTKQFIMDRTARIGVMGLGRIGLSLAMQLCRAGYLIHGFDLDSPRTKQLLLRRKYRWGIYPGEAKSARDRGIHATNDLSKIAETDVLIMCLPLGHTETRELDLLTIRETAFCIASHLHGGHLIIVESPPDSAIAEEVVIPILESANAAHLRVSRNTGKFDEFFVAISPRSESDDSPSFAPTDALKPIGGADALGLELAAELYATITRVIPVPCPTISEVLRLLERTDRFAPTYAALKSKFELLCNRNDGSHTMNLTDFLNRSRAAAELGVPIDPFYFAWKHNELGINVTKAN